MPVNGFIRNGYIFRGWSTDPSVTRETYKVGQEIDIVTIFWDQTSITFFAIWEDTWANHAVNPIGAGSANSPYLISSPENLAWMAKQTITNNLTGYFKQTDHISLAGKTWLPIGWRTIDGSQERYFNGVYDGNGYVITNINTSNAQNDSGNYLNINQGLFGFVAITNTVIKNVTLMSSTIYGDQFVGGICGRASNTEFTNCKSYASIECSNQQAGALVGVNWYNTISACYANATVKGNNHTGGLVGWSQGGSISCCGFEGRIYRFKSGTSGGLHLLVGANSGNGFSVVTDCFAINYTSEATALCGILTNMSNCLYITNETKGYVGTDFSNWVISSTKTPLPNRLCWIAKGGVKVENLQQIETWKFS